MTLKCKALENIARDLGKGGGDGGGGGGHFIFVFALSQDPIISDPGTG